MQACHTALDIQELLSAQVSTEASLGDGVVAKLQSNLGSGHGVAAVSDVCEGSAVDKGRSVLQSLNQVGLQSVLEECSHSALCIQVTGSDRLTLTGVSNHQTSQTVLKVGDVGSQAQNSHDLGSNGDVVAILTGHAVGLAAHAVNNITQLTVVHIDAASPGDLAGVDAQSVALVDVVIQHGSQQVVCSTDCVEVTGEVQVDVLHGDDLCVAAACSTALDAEDGSQGRLTESNDNILAQNLHAVSQANGSGGLALTGGGGVDGGDQNQLAIGVLILV